MDWSIVIVFTAALVAVASYTKRFNRSVADFLAANRCAGRYLLCIAFGAAQLGAASVVIQMQVTYKTGFANLWYGSLLGMPIMAVIVASGWVVYRFRETRAMTLAQFFEMRYSKKFRIFAGIIAFFAGLINYGLFPAIGASFFIRYCGLPEAVGPVPYTAIMIPTFQLVMFVLLGISLYFTFSGGQVTVLATDFIQGMFMNLIFVAIMVLILVKFGVGTILDGMEYAEPGKSLLNPMDIEANEGFNIFYFVLMAFMGVYGYKTWQSEQGYMCAARTPHESKMAGILGIYKHWAFWGILTLVPLAAFTYMHHPDYAVQATETQVLIDQVGNEEVRNQMVVPIVLSQMLPKGLTGLFAAAVFAAFISTHNTQLHSWGSIFIQDVIMPFRKERFSRKTHMMLLKFSVAGVAIFAFLFSSYFKQTQRFPIYAMVTGIIYIGGAGISIMGGLYWKRGTTAGAWAAMTTGAVIGIGALMLEQYWMHTFDKSFPVGFKWWTAIAAGCSISGYIVFSLFSRESFDMDRMLHRGKYRIAQDHEELKEKPGSKKIKKWQKALGLTHEFTTFDKWVWGISIFQAGFYLVYNLTFTIGSFIFDYDVKTWRYIQSIRLWQIVILFAPVAIWLTIGGIRDLISFFRHLSTAKINDLDDGTVVDHHNLADDNADNKTILTNKET